MFIILCAIRSRVFVNVVLEGFVFLLFMLQLHVGQWIIGGHVHIFGICCKTFCHALATVLCVTMLESFVTSSLRSRQLRALATMLSSPAHHTFCVEVFTDKVLVVHMHK